MLVNRLLHASKVGCFTHALDQLRYALRNLRPSLRSLSHLTQISHVGQTLANANGHPSGRSDRSDRARARDVLELGVKIGLIIGLVVYLVLVIGLRDVGSVPVRRELAFLAALAIRLGRCCAVGKGRSLLRLAAFSAVVVALYGLPIAPV